jgi:hypothetical protein
MFFLLFLQKAQKHVDPVEFGSGSATLQKGQQKYNFHLLAHNRIILL